MGLYVGCPHPFNRGVRLIEVEFTVFYRVKFQDFDNCPVNKGYPLGTELLNTGLTVQAIIFLVGKAWTLIYKNISTSGMKLHREGCQHG